MTAIAAIELDPLERARGGDHDAFGQLVRGKLEELFQRRYQRRLLMWPLDLTKMSTRARS